MGMKHLAITDTNGFYGLIWFIQTAKKYGLNPIIGSYIKHNEHHCVMIAKNLLGYRSICSIISQVHNKTNHQLYEFIEPSLQENVVVFSHDLKLLHFFHKQGNIKNVYVELVPHKNREEALHFSEETNIPPVATNECYFNTPEDWHIHKLLRAIDLNTTLQRVPRNELVSHKACFKTSVQMQQEFPNCQESITNTQRIATECTFSLNFKEFIFTSYKGPNGENAFTLLRDRVLNGIEWRYSKLNAEIMKRMDYELSIIQDKGFAPYFLVAQDIVRKAPRTCGRGSAAASLVSYCLGITHVDPIRYDLFFERFLNRGRLDPPDIDVDFPWDERDDILDYIFQKYGAESTAMISNHNTFKARSAVREIAKVFGIPDDEIGVITKKMTGYWQPESIWELTQTHPVYKNANFPEPWPKIIQMAEKIRGFPRHLSVHCGGVIIAPNGTDFYVPSQPAKKVLKLKGVIKPNSGLPKTNLAKSQVSVVQWEKDQSEDMGLIKMDILGNRSLAVIRDALAAIKKNYGININYATWDPLHDPRTILMLSRGESIGVFYVESPAMRQLQIKTGAGDFEHLVIHSSIIRPAANIFINEYIRRLKGGKYKSLHPLLDKQLAETFGIMVYQEDVSKVVMALANFSAAEADDLRKIMSKKHKQKQILDYRDQFFHGAQNNNISLSICKEIWGMIMSFSGYSFCKPHSASYALVSFKSAYLRAHYPAEFIAAVISNQGGYYSPFAYISEARRMGLSIQMPDINKSEKQFSGNQKSVRVGFMQLREISDKTINTLLNERSTGGVFNSFDEFVTRVKAYPADIAKLIKAGCFDSIEMKTSRPALLWRLKQLYAESRVMSQNSTLNLFEGNSIDKANLPTPEEFNEKTVLQHEIETLGFLLSKHPLTLYRDRIKKYNYIKAKELHKFIGKMVTTMGWFITGKTVSTKYEQLMEFISFEDTTAIYETTFFPKAYSKFVHMISKIRPFILSGTVQSHYGAIVLNVEKVNYL
jgi:DNA-directed DNA polymerase III PolC